MISTIIHAFRKHFDLLYQPLISIMIIVSSGINEVFVIFNIIILLSLFIFMKINNDMRIWYLIPLLFAITGLLLTALSKGNSIRMEYYPNAGNIIYSLIYGTLSGSRVIIQALIDPYIWGSLFLFTPVFVKLKIKLPKCILSRSSIILYTLTLLFMLYTVFGIHYYATGNQPVQRLMVVWYIYFYLGVILLAIIMSEKLQKVYSLLEINFNRLIKVNLNARYTLWILVISSFLLINNPPKVIYDLYHTIPGYLIEVKNFNNKVTNLRESEAKPKDLIIEKFKHNPIILKTPTDAEYGIGVYFNFDSVTIIPHSKNNKEHSK